LNRTDWGISRLRSKLPSLHSCQFAFIRGFPAWNLELLWCLGVGRLVRAGSPRIASKFRLALFTFHFAFPFHYAILRTVKSAVLTSGRPALASPAKGDPMKANARQDQGSTMSLGAGLPQAATPPRRFPTVCEKCVHYAYKMRPKFKMQILISVASITYNFYSQKCTHFPVRPAPNRDLPLIPVSYAWTRLAESRLQRTVGGCPFSLGEKVRMRDKPVLSGLLASRRDSRRILYNENRIKPYKTE
jgi:hypothetical protein